MSNYATFAAGILIIALYIYTIIKNVARTSYPNLRKNAKILANQEDEEEGNQLIKEPNHKAKNKYWAFLFCLRSLFLVVFISILSNYPLVQCATALATNVVFFCVILKWRFFDRLSKDVIIKICEAINAVIPLLFLIHAIYDQLGLKMSATMKTNFGWAIIALITTVTVLSLVFLMVELWYVLKRVSVPLLNKLKDLISYARGTDIRGRKKTHLPSLSKAQTRIDDHNERNDETIDKVLSNSFESPESDLAKLFHKVQSRLTNLRSPAIFDNIPTDRINKET